MFDTSGKNHFLPATDNLRAYSKSHPQQVVSANELFIGNKLRTPLSIIAQGPQSGKTGTQVEIAKKYISANPKHHKVVVLSNLADTEVTNTTRADFERAGLSPDDVVVRHRGQIGNVLEIVATWIMDDTRRQNKYLLIIDEAHEALNINGSFSKLLKVFKINLSLNKLQPRDWKASMVVLSATPYAITLWSKCDAVPTSLADIYYPKMPSTYVGLDKVRPRVRQSCAVFSGRKGRPDGLHADFDKHYLSKISRTNFYHIVRLIDKSAMNAFKNFIEEDPIYSFFDVVMFHSLDSDAQAVKFFKSSLERKPERPTIILIAGAARAGTRVCTKYIRSMYEYASSAKSPHDSTLIQSFVGRACGYACEICGHDKARDTFPIFTKRPDTVDRAVEFYASGPALGSRWNKSEIGGTKKDLKGKCWYVLDNSPDVSSRAYNIHKREGIVCHNPNTLALAKRTGTPQPPALTRPIYTISGNNKYDLIGTAVPRYHRGNTWDGVIYLDGPNKNYEASWNEFMANGTIYGFDCGRGEAGALRKFKGHELKDKILVMSYSAPGTDETAGSSDPSLINKFSLLF